MIKQLAHLCIHSPDLAATQHFYCEALAMPIRFRFDKNGELFGFYLDCGGGTFIEVFQGVAGPVGKINHLALEVEDLDEGRQRLASFGYAVGEKKMGADQSWQAWGEDPHGTRIEFHQYTDESMQIVGGVCVVDW